LVSHSSAYTKVWKPTVVSVMGVSLVISEISIRVIWTMVLSSPLYQCTLFTPPPMHPVHPIPKAEGTENEEAGVNYTR